MGLEQVPAARAEKPVPAPAATPPPQPAGPAMSPEQDALGPTLGRIPFGFTSAEMATVMRALGCRQAILLDGGISGQLMVRDSAGGARAWPAVRSVPLRLVGQRR
jgi:hypothetical protein